MSCPVATMTDDIEIQWFDAVNAVMVATGEEYSITNTGSYYCQVTERRGVYRSNTFFVYRTGRVVSIIIISCYYTCLLTL